MTKIDNLLEAAWLLESRSFDKVNQAVAELLDNLVTRATKAGVPLRVATDTYIDWIRSHMEEARFM